MPQSIDDHEIYILNACDSTSMCVRSIWNEIIFSSLCVQTVHGATTGIHYEKTRANFDYVLQISVYKIIFLA